MKDFHHHRGHRSFHFVRKGGVDLSNSGNPRTVQRLHEYLAGSSHGADLEGQAPHPPHVNGRTSAGRRHRSPDMVDRILKKYSQRAGLSHGFSAHSMRASFITTALQKRASLEDVQRDVGHADPTTTKLCGHRGHDPEKSEPFFADY